MGRRPKRSTNMGSSDRNVKEAGEGLPEGWTMKFKTRENGSTAGRQYKCYISPTGCKFYSMQEVSRYLEGKKTKKSASKEAEKIVNGTSKPKRGDVLQLKNNVVIERRDAVDGLPKGWILEIVTKRRGDKVRKDPYYIDPKDGYVFRSKPDALRYLKSGDIRKCAIKPKKRDINARESTDVKSSPPAIAENKELKTGQSSNPNEVAKDGEILESTVAPDIPVSEKEKPQDGRSAKADNVVDDDDDDLVFSLDRVIPLSEYQSDQEGKSAEPNGLAKVETNATPEKVNVQKRGRGRPKKVRKEGSS